MELSGHWSTNSFNGWFEANHIMLDSLKDVLYLPNSRWRRDIDRIIKVEALSINKEIRLPCTLRSGEMGCAAISQGEYDRVVLTQKDNRPYFEVICPNNDSVVEFFELDFATALISPNIEISWA